MLGRVAGATCGARNVTAVGRPSSSRSVVISSLRAARQVEAHAERKASPAIELVVGGNSLSDWAMALCNDCRSLLGGFSLGDSYHDCSVMGRCSANFSLVGRSPSERGGACSASNRTVLPATRATFMVNRRVSLAVTTVAAVSAVLQLVMLTPRGTWGRLPVVVCRYSYVGTRSSTPVEAEVCTQSLSPRYSAPRAGAGTPLVPRVPLPVA